MAEFMRGRRPATSRIGLAADDGRAEAVDLVEQHRGASASRSATSR
jgi:hypothetical protein